MPAIQEGNFRQVPHGAEADYIVFRVVASCSTTNSFWRICCASRFLHARVLVLFVVVIDGVYWWIKRNRIQ